MKVTARTVAWEVLQSVHNDDAYANLILPKAIDQAQLDPRDSRLCTELTYGALRRQGSLDAVIFACASREDIDSAVLDILRLSVYQVLFMRIPAHAAVDEAVEVAKTLAGHGAAKFVNAVMRRVCDKSWSEWVEQLTNGLPKVEQLAIEYSFPVWVIRALADAYKLDADGVTHVLAACNVPAEVTLVARPGQATVEEMLDLHGVRPGQWSPLAAVITRGDSDGDEPIRNANPSDIEAVRDGRIGVQDEGSQLVALALANVAVEHTVEEQSPHWLDMCAGPGGKAAILAGLAHRQKSDFLAVEPNATRAQLIENSLRFAPGSPHVVVGDGREAQADHNFSRILVDAPCTGLGALRRRPEARWRKSPNDIPPLTSLQRDLLASAAKQVAVGGVICYATCSPHIAETDSVVESFLRKHPDFAELDASKALPMLNLEPGTTRVRLRPDVHGTDGMFFTLLRRGQANQSS